MNRDDPTVSVIMIFLNAERFIREAIDSVVRQTYTSWELLLVDDGSSDGSTAIALEYVRRCANRMRYYEHQDHQNQGMSTSRNLGIQHARGQYIGFLDADDCYLPAKLGHQASLLDQHPEVDMIYGATDYWYSWTGEPDDQSRDRVRRQGVPPGSVVYPPDLLLGFLQDEVRTPTTCGVLARRDAIERVGGFEEEFRDMYEDQAFFAKFFLHAPIYIDDARLDRYRQHPDSLVNVMRRRRDWDPSARPTPARGRFLTWLDDYLGNWGSVDQRVKTALDRQLWPYRHPYLSLPLRVTRRARQLCVSPVQLVRRVRGPIMKSSPR